MRSEDKITLTIATFGIAALLLLDGRTIHFRFRLPLDITNHSTCNIKQGSKITILLQKISLIIWDKVVRTNIVLKFWIRHGTSFSFKMKIAQTFGGMTMLLGSNCNTPIRPDKRIES